jgi:deoxyribodipyrimidine photo-lyase
VSAAVVLFTRDLRVRDNPALAAAAREYRQVVPLFVLDEALRVGPHAGRRRFEFLLAALSGLDHELRSRGGRLVVRRGDAVAETVRVAREVGATDVFLNADASAFAHRRERRLGQALRLRAFDGTTVVPLGGLRTRDDAPYRVFTPYARSWNDQPWRDLQPAPGRIDVPEVPSEPPAAGLVGGEPVAREQLRGWLARGVHGYAQRDRLDLDATSRLSPSLHFGCVSPLELALEAQEHGADAFVRQLCWRDFYAQLLHHRPSLQHEDLNPRALEWNDDPEAFDAWREGRTGIPIVDAGMRQLLQEGWMHNRARLITASFLVKDLLIDWRLGAAHYYEQLLDGDVANNSGNWQWIAGSGVDPRPYRRVYNPVLQARRHDPLGDYVRRYVPELSELAEEIHEPWSLGERRLGELGYPPPIVDHREAARRYRALVQA